MPLTAPPAAPSAPPTTAPTGPAAAAPFAAPAAPVPAICVSPDKKLLALAEADGKITLVDLTTGKPVKQLAGHTAAVTSLAFSGNSARLVSGSADKTVRVWDVAAGTAVLTLTGSPQAINAVAIHANGLEAASGAADGQIALPACRVALPDCVLLDWNMPVMNGIEFLTALRAEFGPRKPVVVLCTTETEIENITRAIAFGAQAGQEIAWQAHVGGFFAGLFLFKAFDPVSSTPELTG